ncbi:ABC transporter ATP-binding protein [Thermoanaerobacterium thermosaccharolyticum]|uniref:ABC transporter ATP-binding protein n=1 Tax=Thermoanaerobacterium thermosaccharolyticum TaxID=1517 RepID=UPI00279D34F8|nr:putative tryptophan/tyrosine transport system ATP-binding protein [Thermoanaerobacterium sp.]WHE06640.1 ABC transporter ATP-binding protein [Thermoanaerobacterium thermosaccharolyticum]
MLKLKNVSKSFYKNTPNENQVFKDLNFEVEDGDFVTIVGSNGAGKSTLLNLIAGVYPVDSGSIMIDDVDVTSYPEFKRSKFIGRVFQNPLLGTAPSMTIDENLSIAYSKGAGLSLKMGLNKKNRDLFKEKLAELGLGLENRMKTKVGLLSGGQRQALTLLMATFAKPKLLLLDEHTAALDPRTANIINEITNKIISENNLTTLMVTHNLEHALEYGNRIIMMHQGRIVLDLKDEKKNLTVQKLLKMFNEVNGSDFVDDRVMLA